MKAAHRRIIGLTGIGALLWALQGCFDPSPPAGALCAQDGWCPPSQTCDIRVWVCVPETPQIPDAGFWPDTGLPWWPPEDAGGPLPDAIPVQQGIEGARQAPYGPTYIEISQVLITYVKPAVEYEPAGFFVQREPTGPALFVAVDPAELGASLAAGDRVSFVIWELAPYSGMRMATSITDIVVHTRGNDVSELAQVVSDESDLISALDSYEGELVTLQLRVTGLLIQDLDGYMTARIETPAIPDGDAIRLRVPPSLQSFARLEPNCEAVVIAQPLWRSVSFPKVTAWHFDELASLSCPAPRVVSVTAASDTEVRIELSRTINPDTVLPDGSQFTFSDEDGENDLVATGASVVERYVTVTTTPQIQGQLYRASVAGTVEDVLGAGVDPLRNEASFLGAPAPVD